MHEAGESKKRETRFALFLLALLCFILPFAKIQAKQGSASFTGTQFVTGIEAGQSGPDHQTDEERPNRQRVPVAVAAAVCIILALLSCFAPRRTGKLIPTVMGFGGLLCLALFGVGMSYEIPRISAGEMTVRYGSGLLLTFLFLLLGTAIAGYQTCQSWPLSGSAARGSRPSTLKVPLLWSGFVGLPLVMLVGAFVFFTNSKVNLVERSQTLSPLLGSGKSREPRTAEELLDRALSAHGGEKRLKQLKALRTTQEGRMWIKPGQSPTDYSFEEFYQHPGKLKQTIVFKYLGMMQHQQFGCSGGTCWEWRNGRFVQPRDTVRQQLVDSMHVAALRSLFPLRDGYRQLSLCDPLQVDGKTLPGLSVKTQGEQDAELYFDSQTYLLSRIRVGAFNGEGERVTKEISFHDYRDWNGRKYASRITAADNGFQTLDARITGVEFFPELAENTFQKPGG